MTPEEAIGENAKLVVAQFSKPGMFGPGFGFNRESVEYLDGFIERLRVDLPEEQAGKLVQVFGSYLGECLIHALGGRWKDEDGQWCVFFSNRLTAHPFNKVRKQFDNGSAKGDSLLGFFDATITLANRP